MSDYSINRAALRTVSAQDTVSTQDPVSAQDSGTVEAPRSRPAAELLAEHLGPDAWLLPVASDIWPAYEHVNVQRGLERWLADRGGAHRMVGLVGFRHRMFALADLCQEGMDQGMQVGGVAVVDQPSGPHGAVHACVQCGLFLLSDGPTRTALLLRGSDQRGPQPDVSLEVASTDPAAARAALAEIRALAVEHSVYRGQVISFGHTMPDPRGGGLVTFHPRPRLSREDLVLPDGVLEGIERQITAVAQHRELLLAHGQHLKRGLLLYGAPGVGKTHTLRYLMSSLPETTVILLSSETMLLVHQAAAIARAMQPSLLIIEDVDLIAEARSVRPGRSPLLFQVLIEMDGLCEEVDVIFALTTNQVEALEPALVNRPGRIDHAVEIPLPDAEGRRRLLDVYRGGLQLDLAEPERVLERTEGVAASFLKELLRKSALNAAEARGEHESAERLRVTDEHVHAALDVLLDDANRLTRLLLGGGGGPAGREAPPVGGNRRGAAD